MSRISRGQKTVAYARKQAPADGGGEDAPEDAPDDAALDDAAPARELTLEEERAASLPSPPPRAPRAEAPPAAPETPAATALTAPMAAVAEPALGDSPKPPDAAPARARTSTIAMPVHASVGAPPAMPAGGPPVAAVADPAVGVESPTQMPGPREIPDGNPGDPAAPPGAVPPGDSRSMRRRAETHDFALVYRRQTFVISRVGVVGTRGVWRVVEYPTSASASHAYAKECSRFVSDGFSDYRD